jgi:predicted DNA-binding protein with PD1-like motif
LQDFVERERIHAAALTAIGAFKRCDLAVLQLGDEDIR